MSDERDENERGLRRYGLGVDEISVILVAFLCTAAFVAVLFIPWHLDKLAKGIVLVSTPSAPKIQPKPETQMMLFPAPAKKPEQKH